MKPFLVLQLRPEDDVADNELAAILRFGNLNPSNVHRVRTEKEGIPDVSLDGYSGVIIGGAPYNVSDHNKKPDQRKIESRLYSLMDKIMAKDFPFLGECYGLGILASYLGGSVSKEQYGEGVGAVTVSLSNEASDDPLLAGLPKKFRAFVGHKEACQHVPPQATHLASSKSCLVQMIKVKENIYATQFHPTLDSHALAIRVNAYKHVGYFPPEDAEKLIALAHKETITVPELILGRFVERYSQPKRLTN
ncbi:glutamine amidotransferase [Candidatus Saccharibacteria bacterium]|nr:glutamine amidotransferase [Candidatus Saccharibacteria bacterium]